VQEVNAKRAKICLPPALCFAVICRQTVRKTQENQRAYNMRLTCRIKQNYKSRYKGSRFYTRWGQCKNNDRAVTVTFPQRDDIKLNNFNLTFNPQK